MTEKELDSGAAASQPRHPQEQALCSGSCTSNEEWSCGNGEACQCVWKILERVSQSSSAASTLPKSVYMRACRTARAMTCERSSAGRAAPTVAARGRRLGPGQTTGLVPPSFLESGRALLMSWEASCPSLIQVPLGDFPRANISRHAQTLAETSAATSAAGGHGGDDFLLVACSATRAARPLACTAASRGLASI